MSHSSETAKGIYTVDQDHRVSIETNRMVNEVLSKILDNGAYLESLKTNTEGLNWAHGIENDEENVQPPAPHPQTYARSLPSPPTGDGGDSGNFVPAKVSTRTYTDSERTHLSELFNCNGKAKINESTWQEALKSQWFINFIVRFSGLSLNRKKERVRKILSHFNKKKIIKIIMS
ncbi:uncharacterized protein, partial [Lepeophtheirus salmonis]|uniref:uncharacterized protein n=1 Tax=Lepeophtheirus salmonis TaxID=72036 RepID=UPI003AF3A9C2